MVREDRTVRVFVSSTFRDMQAERDELIKRVFPRLRKLCERRGVTWGEVDLRWGITDEQKAEGRVLPVCLEEIRRCRPYFIGLLGERYGWVPDQIDPELLSREPWLQEHQSRSVTELEIVHGVLNDPEMAGHSFFYLRDPAYVDSLEEEQQPAFREGPAPDEIAGPEEGEERAEKRRGKLAALKGRIRGSGLPVRDYPDPQAAGELILQDLTGAIDRLFPEGSEPDLLEREAAEHEAFARTRAGVYIGRSAYFDRLDAHAAGEGSPLVVLGESGSGKSALLANWARAYREAHPDVPVVMHFVGSSPQSADWAKMLRRVMGDLARRFGIEGEIPDGAEELRVAFADWLHMASARGRVVLVLDALNQLEDREGAPDLVWLPPEIPDGVRLVVSTLPGRPLREIERRGWPVLEVEPLEPVERAELIREYLAQYRKKLSPAQGERIGAATQSANPLFLRVLLEELRLWGEHETLDERIAHYLAASGPAELYRLVLERWEADYERERPRLVADAMSLVWAARRGLSEAELMDLLGDGERLPAARWSPFSLAAEQALVNRAGLIGFAHDFLRQAVQHAYVPTEPEQTAAHLRLADYFDARRDEPRAVDELPWHLVEAKSWERLRDLLVDGGFFKRAWEASESDVRVAWARIEASSLLRMADAYRLVIERPDADHAWEVARLLIGAGHLSEASALGGRLIERYRTAGDPMNLGRALGNHGAVLRARGDLDGAMAFHREEEQILRDIGDHVGLQACLGNQALILRARGDLDGAMELNGQQEQLSRELGDRLNVQRSLGNQGAILFLKRDLDGAMARFLEKERMCRELGHLEGVQAALGNQGGVLQLQGDLDGALALFAEQERVCRELGSKAGLQACLTNQGLALKAGGDLDGAMALFQESARLSRELGDRAALQTSLGYQASLLHDQADLPGAMEVLRERETLCRELEDLPGLQATLARGALILREVGRLDDAMAVYEEEEGICRELGAPRALVTCLANKASLLRKLGRSREALLLAEEAGGLAAGHGLTALSAQVERILEGARQEVEG